MEVTAIIIVTCKRTGTDWTATASYMGEYAGSCTAKSKAYAEKEARKAGETYSRNRPAAAPPKVVVGAGAGYSGPLNQLVPTLTARLQAAANTASTRMLLSMAALLLVSACTHRSAPHRSTFRDAERPAPDSVMATRNYRP